MSTRRNSASITEEQIDELVTEEANDDGAWGDPIHVQPFHSSISLRLPADLLRRKENCCG